jgi:hypothetical protein
MSNMAVVKTARTMPPGKIFLSRQLILNQNNKGFPIEEAHQIQDYYNLLPVRSKVTEI